MTDRLRIFLSSPGDVAPERLRARLVIARLAQDYAQAFRLEPYLWEYEPMLASGHFQDVIEPPRESDIVLLIVWSRLGTNLPPDRYRRADNTTPVTGTEWEFEDARAAQKQRGVPDLLVYRKTTEAQAPLSDSKARAEKVAQWDALEAFWQRNFADDAGLKTAFSTFKTLDEFEQTLEKNLRKLIERRIRRRASTSSEDAIWLKGNPFRGLQSYSFEHASIFFGRSKAIQDSVEQLVANADLNEATDTDDKLFRGRAFLLILGASGTGKSSLAQAGIVPTLTAHGIVARIGLWRRALMRPAGHKDGVFHSLAAALTEANALPELLGPGQTVDELARHLQSSAGDPAYPISTALARIEANAKAAQNLGEHERAALIVVVDQLEELFTTAKSSPEIQAAFVACLDALSRSGRIMVVATMRTDQWHRAAEVPLLRMMATGEGQMDLLAPTLAEIGEMIGRPARAAGLSFERDPKTEIGLDAALQEEAVAAPGALPLLSYLLEELYGADVHGKDTYVLTWNSARKLNGLRGAIAARARNILAARSDEVRAALPELFQLLIQCRLGEAATARPADLASVPGGSPLRQLIDAMQEARLLVADGDEAGAQIRFAHEALLTHWQAAADWINQNRRDLETRARLEESFALWSAEAGKPGEKERLLTGVALAEAADLARRWQRGLPEHLRGFVQASEAEAKATRARTLRTRLAAAALLLLAFAATSFFVYEPPHVTLEYQRATLNGAFVTQIFVKNSSASMATIESVTLQHGRKTYSKLGDAVTDAFDLAQVARLPAASVARPNAIMNQVVPANDELEMVRLNGDWRDLIKSTIMNPKRYKFEVCYCSALATSWIGRTVANISGIPYCWIADRVIPAGGQLSIPRVRPTSSNACPASGAFVE